MGWYVVFKEGRQTLTQTVEDKDEALLVASDLYLRGKQVLSIGPFGQDARSDREFTGAVLRALLRKMVRK